MDLNENTIFNKNQNEKKKRKNNLQFSSEKNVPAPKVIIFFTSSKEIFSAIHF